MRSFRLGLAALLGLVGLAGRAAAVNPSQFAITVQMVPAPAPVVTKVVTPGTPGIGGPCVYRIVVTNAGAGTVTGLTVVDTVSPVVVNALTAEPPGFAPASVASVAGTGSRYEWSAGGLTMGPSASFTFTITGRAGFVCAPVSVGNTAYVVATGPGGTAAAFSPSAGFVLQPAGWAISVAKFMTPASPVAGGPVTYTLVATNTGAATVTGLTVTDTISPVVTGAAAQQTAPFVAPTVVSGASGTLYAWTAAVAMTPGLSYTFTVSGTVGTVTAATTVGNTVYASAAMACAPVQASTAGPSFTLGPSVVLQARLSAGPAMVSVGQSFLVTMTVTNTGAGTATGVNAGIWSGSAAASWAGTAATTSVATLGPGATVVFTWTATAASTGSISWTGTVSANEAVGSAGSTAAITVQSAAALTVSASSSAAGVCTGQTWQVYANVANTGQAAAAGVSAVVWQSAGPGSATWTGPWPASATVAIGSPRTFTFTVSGVAVGPVTLTVTAAGNDVNSGFPSAGAPATAGAVTVGGSAVLTANVALPGTVSVGQAVTVTAYADNTVIGSTATGVAVTATTTGGASVSGPVSPSSQPIAGGNSGSFNWVYTPLEAGAHVFSVAVNGSSCGSPVSAVAGGTVTVQVAPVLSGILLVTTPATTVEGVVVVVTLTVTNTGGVTANGVTATVNPVGAAGTIGGPYPAGPVVITGGGPSRTFMWTYTTTGAGSLSFNASASGVDANSGYPVGTGVVTSSAVTVQTRAQLVVTALDVPVAIRVGDVLSATVTVQNTGQSGASGVTMVRVLGDPNGALGAPAPAMPAPFALAGGASSSFAWWYPSTSCGPITVSLTVTGTDSTTSAFLFAAATGTSGVAGLPAFVVAGANPSQGMVGTRSVISVTVYDSCMPAQRVPGVAVSLVVITGDGRVEQPTGVTNGSGDLSTTFWIGNQAGTNGIRIDVAGTPGATVTVEGTTPSSTVDYLSKNFFDPRTGDRVRIRVFVPSPVHLSVRVYNLAAELVRIVREADVQPGLTSWEWDGRNEQGELVGNGTYFIQIVAGRDTQIRRVIVLKR